MKEGSLSIHSENILPIIKKWLYSDKDIFLRELVSNSTDAINKLKLLEQTPKESFRIDINIDKKNKTLSISDNGIGMNEEEVKKYIAQIAFSGAEEFLEKYKNKEQIIGHFGLGFYSSYMVAEKVEIDTLSYIENETSVFWSCDGSSTYQIGKGKREKVGTTVTLFIDKENEEFLEENTIKQILLKYCPYLPFAIYLNNEHINNKDPLWLKNLSSLTEKDYLNFYSELYPHEPEPIFWIHLNVEYPFHLKGILYFPKVHTQFDINKSMVKLFCNRVFVSDNCKDILPDYLLVLRGAIDSPDIPLNVSRSYLQMDRVVRQLSSHISKKVSDRLSSLYSTEREKFISFWKDIEIIIKLGILQDEKFYEKSKKFLIFQNTQNEWTTIEEYLERKDEKKVLYTQRDKEDDNLLSLYHEKNIEILILNSHIDTALINFLEDKLKTQFSRIDGSINQTLLDPSREKTLIDTDGKSQSAKIADFIRSSLTSEEESLEVEAKSLSNDDIPAFIMMKEEERRLRDYINISQKKDISLPTKKTLVVNTNNSLINNIIKLSQKNKDLATSLIRNIYDLTLLSQRELATKEFPKFIKRSKCLLEKLTQDL